VLCAERFVRGANDFLCRNTKLWGSCGEYVTHFRRRFRCCYRRRPVAVVSDGNGDEVDGADSVFFVRGRSMSSRDRVGLNRWELSK
jgi:hypothetical protein